MRQSALYVLKDDPESTMNLCFTTQSRATATLAMSLQQLFGSKFFNL